ncbi:MAG TPA: TIGR01777 family oxidoreductase [Bryobacteraceae bacterium]|nr:TIGR01777 family oxidoreductase [Bryobacteraceae bacterium]
MNVLLTGASGFIGHRLIARSLHEGHSVHAVGRRPPAGFQAIQFSEWKEVSQEFPARAIETSDAIVHLAGEPIAQKWNPEVKAKIRDSRVNGTRKLVESIAKQSRRPQVLISASAIGYYGDRGEELLDENSTAGTGFLPEVCIEWERAAREAGNLGLRVVLLRTGIVLGKEGGALKQMLTPFKLGVGGPTGSGKQWMSWIHIDDLVSAMMFALATPDVAGPVNGTAPNPVRNRELTSTLGAALGRPAVVPTPTFALKLMLGEAARIVLESQKVLPTVLQAAGFPFRHRDVDEALRHAVQS